VLLAILWVLLTGGAVSSWVVGLPTVLLGSAVTLVLPPLPAWRWRVGGAVRFLTYFLVQSLLSAVDVARRAVHPRCPLEPRLIAYPFSSLHGPARIFFANAVSLLPGTLSADLQDQEVLIHVLDCRQPITNDLKRLEEKVAILFGMESCEPCGDRR
jgi:multicomponent Na+:H+ antiporter subunit E